MIRIDTTLDGTIKIVTTRALNDVATELFGGDSDCAIHRLSMSMTMNAMHVTERLALFASHDEALAYARKNLINRQG